MRAKAIAEQKQKCQGPRWHSVFCCLLSGFCWLALLAYAPPSVDHSPTCLAAVGCLQGHSLWSPQWLPHTNTVFVPPIDRSIAQRSGFAREAFESASSGSFDHALAHLSFWDFISPRFQAPILKRNLGKFIATQLESTRTCFTLPDPESKVLTSRPLSTPDYGKRYFLRWPRLLPLSRRFWRRLAQLTKPYRWLYRIAGGAVRPMSFLLIMILLLMGCVESNPGPVLTQSLWQRFYSVAQQASSFVSRKRKEDTASDLSDDSNPSCSHSPHDCSCHGHSHSASCGGKRRRFWHFNAPEIASPVHHDEHVEHAEGFTDASATSGGSNASAKRPRGGRQQSNRTHGRRKQGKSQKKGGAIRGGVKKGGGKKGRSRFCGHPRCHKQPSFGYPGQSAECCAEHKAEGMENVAKKKCSHDGCGKKPSYGFPGQSAERCAEHKIEGMEDVVKKKCSHDGCGKRPSYGFPGQSAERCFEHKTEGMENVMNKRCSHVGCEKRPSFGFPGQSAERCFEHKTEGMEDVVNKRCNHVGCGKHASYGFPGQSAECCFEHKTEGMENVVNKRCSHVGCGKQPSFGFPGQSAECCAEHKAEGMENVKVTHCVGCGVSLRYDEYCPGCDARLDPLTKEKRITLESKAHARVEKEGLEPDYHNKQPEEVVCGVYRPDFLWKAISAFFHDHHKPKRANLMHYVCGEVDEDDHRYYDPSCELKRMMELHYNFGGYATIFVRVGVKYKDSNRKVNKLYNEYAKLVKLALEKEDLAPGELQVWYIGFDSIQLAGLNKKQSTNVGGQLRKYKIDTGAADAPVSRIID